MAAEMRNGESNPKRAHSLQATILGQMRFLGSGRSFFLMAGFFSTVCQAHVLTDGLAAAEACRMPLLGFLAKSVREAAFPTPLVQKAA